MGAKENNCQIQCMIEMFGENESRNAEQYPPDKVR